MYISMGRKIQQNIPQDFGEQISFKSSKKVHTRNYFYAVVPFDDRLKKSVYDHNSWFTTI